MDFNYIVFLLIPLMGRFPKKKDTPYLINDKNLPQKIKKE